MDNHTFTMTDGSVNAAAAAATTAMTMSATSGSKYPPVIARTTSGLSHDTASGIASIGSNVSGQQTRFSFYNAEDFRVTSIDSTMSASKSSPPSPKKSPKSIKLKQSVVETVEAQQQLQHREEHSLNHDAASSSDIDSNEILRSLQEHEQQRLDILAGPKRKVSISGGTISSSTNHSNHSNHSGTHSEENSNPYEDAIKEALQLIRRHRAPIISEPQTSTESLLQQSNHSKGSINSVTTNENSNDRRLLKEPPTITLSHEDEEFYDDDPAIRLTSEFQSLMAHSTRSLPDGISTIDVSHEQQSQLPPTSTTSSNPGLGEAYQAEIEARRRQRQERMARYASRLAELKQEDHNNRKDGDTNADYADEIPMVDTARSLDSSVDYGSSGIGRGMVTARQYRTNTSVAAAAAAATCLNRLEPGIAMSRSWEDDVLVSMSRSNHEGFDPSFVAAPNNAASITGSVSTLTNTLRPDDEIQRGVERVLMAILERANSRGRTAVEGRLLERHHPAISDPMKVPPISGNDEKKLNDEKRDDVLVQAMSDLLGPSTLSSALPLHEGSDSPSAVALAQKDNDVDIFKTNGDHNKGYTANILASSNGFGNSVNFNKNVDARSRLEVSVTKSMSSPEEPIAPIETLSSRNIDDDVDDQSASDYNRDDDTTDDVVDDEDDDGTDEDDSRTYDDEEDDDMSRSDDYDSNQEREHSEKRVLGPLNKRSGGTTGVVLDDYSSESSASYDDQPVTAPQPSSILDSLSAAVSRVTGIAKVDDNDHSGRSDKGDKYAMDDVESEDESDASTDSEANDLMRSLCAHLLPISVDRKTGILDDVPEWDESNPDEAGYRIVRLTSFQLRSIEKEYDRLIESLQKKSQLILSPKVGIDDSAFEIDLQAAEKRLEEKGKKLKDVEILQQPIHSAKSLMVESIPKADSSTVIDNIATKKEVDESDCLACFPGVKPAGKGEMGELEYFSLPIIFKSHVTGFEPTKDIVLEPGNVVAGQYLVEGVLGSAAFSTAYRCVDLSSEEDSSGCQDSVCLKVIKNTKDFFDQSLDEIKILELLRQTGKCNEKFIVEMKTFFYHREHLIIVTELLRQNLFEFGKFILDSGEEPYFTLPRLSYIARQCFIALEFVHNMGLVHSDVKPENILLASYSRAQAKLIDFGSSCYLTDRQSSYIQSRSYRAPEVVLGLPYDGRIDIWSLGCVIAEMFTGDVTFQNDSVVSMLSRIEAICGSFPRHMVEQGRQSARFYAKCGLLFEKVVHDTSDNTEEHSVSGNTASSYDDDDENHRRVYIDIFQPKITTLAARMGFAPNLMDKFDKRTQMSADEQRQAYFCDLIRKLLTIDPEIRLTATEALNHPAMIYAASLTEADVKYPSS